MGTFTVTLEVARLQGDQFVEVEALVDTGARHTMLSRELLSRLGVEATESVSFQLADDRIIDYDVCEAHVRLDGRDRTTLVVFGPEGSQALLGATTLQLFNLAVDTIQEELVPVRGLLK